MVLAESIVIISNRLERELLQYEPTMMLFGSVVLDDFKFGWSDIDFLLLTEKPLDKNLAASLVYLRQTLADENNGNPYFRLFEGAIMTKHAFLNNGKDTVVYWGTSGQRLADSHEIDPFAKIELIENGKLLFGRDFGTLLPYPTRSEIVRAVRHHYDVIRKFGNSGAGWFLDISRCLYTLRTTAVIAKTKAGEWAISENLCPDISIMKKVLDIRKNPSELMNCEETKKWQSTLKPHIQKFADVMEAELKNQ